MEYLYHLSQSLGLWRKTFRYVTRTLVPLLGLRLIFEKPSVRKWCNKELLLLQPVNGGGGRGTANTTLHNMYEN